jgi:Domain of unknown function (DUF4082)
MTTFRFSGTTTILDGIGYPPDDLGNVGNYYLDTARHTLYGPKIEIDPDAAIQPTTLFTDEMADVYLTEFNEEFPFPMEIGMEIEFLAPGTITSLRYYRPSEMPPTITSTTFKVWDVSSQTLIRTISSTNELGYGWQILKLNAPINVNAYQKFRIVIDMSEIGRATMLSMHGYEYSHQQVISHGNMTGSGMAWSFDSDIFPENMYSGTFALVDVVFVGLYDIEILNPFSNAEINSEWWGASSMGMKLQFLVDASIIALRFAWSNNHETLALNMSLWSDSGVLLGTAIANRPDMPDLEEGPYPSIHWSTANLTFPVQVVADQKVIVVADLIDGYEMMSGYIEGGSVASDHIISHGIYGREEEHGFPNIPLEEYEEYLAVFGVDVIAQIGISAWPIALSSSVTSNGGSSSIMEHEAEQNPHPNYLNSYDASNYYEEKYHSHGTGATYRWSNSTVSLNGYYDCGSNTGQLNTSVSYLWFDKQDITYNDQAAMFLALRAGDSLFIVERGRQYTSNSPWMRYDVTGPVTVGTEGDYYDNYKVPVSVLAGSRQNPGIPSSGIEYEVQLFLN